MSHISNLYFDYTESPFQVGHDIYEADVPEWINNGNGCWEFTGEILDNIPLDLRDTIQFVSAPNATIVSMSYLRNLKSVEAPKTKKV